VAASWSASVVGHRPPLGAPDGAIYVRGMGRSIKRCIGLRVRRVGLISGVLWLLVICVPNYAAAQAAAVVASVEVVVEDYPEAPGQTNGFATMVHRTFLVQPDGTRIRVKGVHAFKTGDKVTFTKDKLHGKPPKAEPVLTEATIDVIDLTLVPSSGLPAATIVKWSLLVINTPSHPAGWLSAQAEQDTMANVDAFWRSGSFGAFGITGTVYEATIAEPDPSICGYLSITSAGQAVLAAQGITAGPYIHTVFPSKSACGWGGLAYVGGYQSWGNGGLWTIQHEGGHNLGMGHSGFYKRNNGSFSNDAYGDSYDPMGQCCDGPRQQYNAAQKVQILKWLTSQIVTASGTYTLAPYEGTTGTRVLEFLPQAGSSSIYPHSYVESRANYSGAVIVHWGTSIWDVDPGSPDVRVLAPGVSTVLDTGETLTTISSGATGATIQVVFPGDPGGMVAPTAVQWTPSGGSVPIPTAPTAVTWSPQ
jgi:hypothetical protein